MKNLLSTLLVAVVGAIQLGLMPTTASSASSLMLPEPKAVVWDFQRDTPNYGYEGWSDLGSVAQRTPAGYQIRASAQGGLGLYFPHPIDLSDASALRLRLTAHQGHTDERMLIKVITSDGKSIQWEADLSDLTDDRQAAIEFAVEPAAGGADFKKQDLSQVRQIQLQGSFAPGTTVFVTLVILEKL